MDNVKTYTLYIPKWRCGSDSARQNARLGLGETRMLNEQGYMCCLGQFAAQAGVAPSELLGVNGPCGVGRLYDPNFVKQTTITRTFYGTDLAIELVKINDCVEQDIWAKVSTIESLLEEYGLKLIVVDPDNILNRQ